MFIYTINKGDNLYKIAQKYKVTTDSIIDANQIEDPLNLPAGLSIVIPTDFISHTVSSGESLYLISRRYSVSIPAILSANPTITNPARIYAGQVILIPANTSALKSIIVNGYAFPNISTTTLNNTLPYLTYLSIFSYQVRTDGSLTPINDTSPIATAKNAGVTPFMVITNIAETGGFNSDLVSTILSSDDLSSTLLTNILNTLEQKGYGGLNIDFEYIYPQYREKYNNFLQKTVDLLRPLGYKITTSLAPKISANQQGLLYVAHDYDFHGSVADYVILMTYEWGYSFSEPRAVAPIDQVKRVLDYATSVIPSNKILIGMPNYGYDWTLPYRAGTAARSLSNLSAIRLATNTGSVINYDTKSQAPYFNYYATDGKRHVVWFNDAKSIKARLELINDYNLGGASFWTINSFFKSNFLILDGLFRII